MAWRGADLRRDEIALDLTRRHATALEELLVRFRKQGLGLGQILPQHCRHPALDAELARVIRPKRSRVYSPVIDVLAIVLCQ
jgi:hypothetical protein